MTKPTSVVLALSLFAAQPALARVDEPDGPAGADARCQPRFETGRGNPLHRESKRYHARYRPNASLAEPFEWQTVLKIAGLRHCEAGRRAGLRLVLREAVPGAVLEPIPRHAQARAKKRKWRRGGGDAKRDVDRWRLRYETSKPRPGRQTFRVELRDRGRTIESQTLTLNIESKWRGQVLPGAHFAVYQPNGADAEGHTWLGAIIEVVSYAWIIRNEGRGPSHGKVALQTALLQTEARDGLTLIYGATSQFSFERNPARKWLLPFFGFQLGGIFTPVGGGDRHSFQVTPQMGTYVYADEHTFLTLSGGYVVPFSDDIEAQRGYLASAGLHFTLW